MLKKIKALIAVAALSGAVGANVQAAGVTVNKGDTLWNISKVHNASVENIKKWNKLSTDIIHPGEILAIPQQKHYSVKLGDTLWDIAKANDVTVGQIEKWNKLSTEHIKPGLNLFIYENAAMKKTSKGKNEKEVLQVWQHSTMNQKLRKSKKSVQSAKSKNRTSNVKVKAVLAHKSVKKVIKVRATAYTASCKGCSGITRTGVNLKAKPHSKVIAVDPTIIPLGSKVFVEGYGYATAADTGGRIKGHRIDVFIPSLGKAMNWGSKHLKVTIIN